MRIIFLDFDGVLNTIAYLMRMGERWTSRTPEAHALDPELVGRLNAIVDATGALVVVSSSWRHGRTVPQLQDLLSARGFKGTVLDTTPRSVPCLNELSRRMCGDRGDEIRAWLNGRHYVIAGYVVLDDSGDMDAVRDHFVQTATNEGLTDDHVSRAITILLEGGGP
jgi:hypothetical protein